MEEKKRILWIDKNSALDDNNYIGMFDLVKGIIMLEIILLHSINDYQNFLLFDGNAIHKLLLSPLVLGRYGAVPMLFMICGYGIRRQKIATNIKNNLKLFVFPYLCVIISITICVSLKQLLSGESLWLGLRYQVRPFFFGFHPGSQLLGDSIGQIGPVWFFLTYILGAMFLNLVLQEKQKWVQALVLGICTIIGLCLCGLKLPFCIQQILICSGYMYVGIWLKQGKIPQKKMPIYLVLLLYVICCFCSEFGGLAEIGNNIYGLGGIDLLLSYIAGVVLLSLHHRLNVLQGILADGLRWIGRHMMWFCCFHTISYLVVPWNRFIVSFGKCYVLGIILEFVISFLYAATGCYLLDRVMKRMPPMKRRKVV